MCSSTTSLACACSFFRYNVCQYSLTFQFELCVLSRTRTNCTPELHSSDNKRVDTASCFIMGGGCGRVGGAL